MAVLLACRHVILFEDCARKITPTSLVWLTMSQLLRFIDRGKVVGDFSHYLEGWSGVKMRRGKCVYCRAYHTDYIIMLLCVSLYGLHFTIQFYNYYCEWQKSHRI